MIENINDEENILNDTDFKPSKELKEKINRIIEERNGEKECLDMLDRLYRIQSRLLDD